MPSVKMMPDQNVNVIAYGCCVSTVMVNKMISCSNIARITHICSILNLWVYYGPIRSLIISSEYGDKVQHNNQRILFTFLVILLRCLF